MTKKKTAKEARVAVMAYLPPKVAGKLARAAKATDVSMSAYIQAAIKEKFKRDGIK
jgi:hypothetical protein